MDTLNTLKMYFLQRLGMFHCYVSVPECKGASMALAAFWTDSLGMDWTAWQDLLQAVIRHRLFVPWLRSYFRMVFSCMARRESVDFVALTMVSGGWGMLVCIDHGA